MIARLKAFFENYWDKQLQKETSWLYHFDAQMRRYSFEGRLAVLCAAIFSISIIWYFLLYNPLQNNKAHWQTQVVSERARLKDLQAEYQANVEALDTRAIQQQTLALQTRMDALNEEITQVTKQVVPADKMVDLLRQTLETSQGLTLLGIKSLPPEPINPVNQNVAETAEHVTGQENEEIASYAVEMTWKGDYQHTVAYLEKLEQLSWRLFWDSLSFRVIKYPDAEVKITLHTLMYQPISGQEIGT